MEKILIIEDDEAIAQIEKDYLEINDYEVTICKDGISGIDEAMKGNYSLILLDLMLPVMDGFNVCKRLREHLDIPILMVSAKQEDANQILGLGLGADDYIKKPFEPSVLVARVKSNINQYKRNLIKKPVIEDKLECGDIIVYPNTRRVYVDKEEVLLKNKEFEMLLFFIEHKDMVCTKDMLYEKIWGMDCNGDTATVAVHVNRLREKLEKDPAKPEHLETIWGVGYRFS